MTNPPIPPAVVETMARAMCLHNVCAPDEVFEGLCLWKNWEDEAEVALSAALATGSVVICSPELRELLDCAVAAAGALGGSRVNNLRHAADEYTRSLVMAQVSQEPK